MAIAEDDFVVGEEVDNLKLNVDPFHRQRPIAQG